MMEADLLRDPILAPLFERLNPEIDWGRPGMAGWFSVGNDPGSGRLKIRLKPGIERRISIPDGLGRLVYALLRHEDGHTRVCPGNASGYLAVRDAVGREWSPAVSRWKVPRDLARSLQGPACDLVAALFCDLVVDSVEGEDDDTYREGTGIALTLMRAGAVCDLAADLRRVLLCGGPPPDTGIPAPGILAVLERFCDPAIRDRTNWPKTAGEFARAVFPLLIFRRHTADRSDRGRSGSSGGDGDPSGRSPSRPDAGRASRLAAPAGDGDRDDFDDAGGIFTSPEDMAAAAGWADAGAVARRLEEDEQYRSEKLRDFVEYVVRPDGPGKVPGDCFMAENDILDAFFQARASEIGVDPEISGRAVPMYLGRAPVAGHRGAFSGPMQWGASRLQRKNDRWQLGLYRKAVPWWMPAGGGGPHPVPPDLALILDSSQSMGPANEPDSRYHLLLLSVYSLFRYLSRTGDDRRMRFLAVNFSNQTLVSKWVGYDRLPELRRGYVLPVQGGRTRLDPGALDGMVRYARRNFWALMITDGELADPEKTVAAVERLRWAGNVFSLIQIGEPGEFCRGVEAIGGDVAIVGSAEDLPGLVLGRGMKLWR